jgi:hypothetical protein
VKACKRGEEDEKVNACKRSEEDENSEWGAGWQGNVEEGKKTKKTGEVNGALARQYRRREEK